MQIMTMGIKGQWFKDDGYILLIHVNEEREQYGDIQMGSSIGIQNTKLNYIMGWHKKRNTLIYRTDLRSRDTQ